MGSVYEAEDERLGRQVAVKILRAELADDERFVERFRREAHAAASLSHPNVAAVFDHGEDAGTRFIVMELVDAPDLAQVLRQSKPLDPARAVRIAVQICDALQHAHDRGIVHRDVKSANVLVGAEDHVKVTDFGIARAAGDVSLTRTGITFGSAHYFSPEQAAAQPVTHRSDLYSAGIVLFEMLTGTLPFKGDSPIAVAMQHLREDVAAPSSVLASVPPALDHVVAVATAKQPEDRYESARAMREALAVALEPPEQPPIQAPPGALDPSEGGAAATQLSEPMWATVPERPTDLTVTTAARRRSQRFLAAIVAAVVVVAVVVVLAFATRGSSPSLPDRPGSDGGGAEPESLEEALDELEEAIKP